jgi:hypothetical protein
VEEDFMRQPFKAVSLGISSTNKFRSAVASICAGAVAGFGAGVLCSFAGATVVGNIAGNSDGSTAGWSFARLADVAPTGGAPTMARLTATIFRVGGIAVVATASVPASFLNGRDVLLELDYTSGSTLNFYLNGALVASEAVATAFVPGASGFTIGGTQASDVGTTVNVSSAYYTTATNYRTSAPGHAAMFASIIAFGGKAMQSFFDMLTVASGIPQDAVYEMWDLRPAIGGTQLLANHGSLGTVADLTRTSSTVFVLYSAEGVFSGNTLGA